MTATTARPRPRGRYKPEPEVAPPPEAYENRPVPGNIGAEVALCGSLFLDPTILPDVMDLLTAESFIDEKTRTFFEAFTKILKEQSSETIMGDGVILAAKLAQLGLLETLGGLAYLDEIVNSIPSPCHWRYYAGIVADHAKRRKIIQNALKVMKEAYESPLPAEQVEDEALALFTRDAIVRLSGQASAAELIQATMESMDRASEGGNAIPTGWVELDNLLGGGLHRGEFIVAAARPSVGKSALAQNIIEHNCRVLGKPCALFSLEMNKEQLGLRWLANHTGCNMQRLRNNMLSAAERDRVARAVGEICQWPLWVDDTVSVAISALRARAAMMVTRHQVALIVVDYLQLVEAEGDNRQVVVSEISRGLKRIARELNVPVLALAQINRDSEKTERPPRLSDLRESGSIEQDADVVMLLHREALWHRGDADWWEQNQYQMGTSHPGKAHQAVIIVGKQRNGPIDNLTYYFHGPTVSFMDLEQWNASALAGQQQPLYRSTP